MIVVGRARSNGFEFRRWYTARLGLPWISAEAALALLDSQRRYYALLFSHEFASSFWKAGEDITFQVPAQTFQRRMPDGTVQTITRKPFTRRSARRDAWRYHLRQMALAEEPLRYLRRYLNVEEEFPEDMAAAVSDTHKEQARAKLKREKLDEEADASKRTRTKPLSRPLPTELPAFLRRPYTGSFDS